MSATLDLEPDVRECRILIDRASSCLNVLHIGPLDSNITQVIDDLLTAAKFLERLKQERCGE